MATETGVTANLFRQVMSNFATGVTVVTTRTPEGVYGMTANAVSSVSLEPLLVLVCVDRKASAHRYIQGSKVFAVNILSEFQKHLSMVFAQKEGAPERSFTGIEYETALTGSPVIPGCLAYLDCVVVAEYPGGDHTIFLGEVKAAEVRDNVSPPLLFFRSQYVGLEKHRDGD